MEIKCDICGTINDGSTNFCKGCFQKLDAERKQNVVTTDDSVVSVIEKEEVKEVPWNNDAEIENAVPDPTPVVDNWEPTGVNGEAIKKEEVVEEELGKTEVLDFGKLPAEEVASVEETVDSPVQENVEPVIETSVDEPVTETSEPTEVLEPIGEGVSEQPVEENTEVQEPVIEEVTEAIGETTEQPVIEENWDVPVEEPVEQAETLEQVVEPISEEVTTVEPLEDNGEIQKDVNEEIIEPISELTEEKIDEPVKVEEKVNEDDWSKDPVEEVETNTKEPNYVSKFAINYIISMIVVFGVLIFTTKYLNEVFDNVTSDIVSFAIYRLAALFTLIISAILTFKKQVPSIERMNSVTFKMLGFVAVPGILIQLFVLGFIKNTKVLMFIVGVMLSLIVLVIFFSYIRNIIKKKNETHVDDKVFFIYGIVNIVLIIGLLGFGIYARSHDLNMPKIDFLYSMFNDTKADEETVNKFVEQVQLRILEDQETIENYQFPKRIDDVEYATYEEKTPEAINLKLNDQGAIIGGTIKYRGITYTYDGEKIKVD